MHAICVKSKYSLLSWAWAAVPWPGGVEGDFLEAPSQMLENFCYDATVLTRLSTHHQSGERVPRDVVDKLSAMRFLSSGFRYKRQVFMSLFDVIIHLLPPPYSAARVDAFLQKGASFTVLARGQEDGVGDGPELCLKGLWRHLEHSFTHHSEGEGECVMCAKRSDLHPGELRVSLCCSL